MDCGTSDFVCQLASSLKHFDLLNAIAALWVQLTVLVGHAREFAVTHAQTIVGIGGLCFGVWKWWYHRERVLHKRLQEYLTEQDRRLDEAQTYVLEALYRPGSTRTFCDPLFAIGPLRNVLKRRRWEAIFRTESTETSADRSLSEALRKVQARLETTANVLDSYRDQQASIHLLKGAIAAARAPHMRSITRRSELDHKALVQFRTVQSIPQHERNVQAKEYEAHQLRRLGHLTSAMNAYVELERLTKHIPQQKERNLSFARAKRGQAEIVQARAAGGALSARDHIVEALQVRENIGPFVSWELIEQGDLHYLHSYIRHCLNHNVVRGQQLSLAETAYRGVLHQVPRRRWFRIGSTNRLRMAAQAGLERVERARANSTFDEEWLLPPSEVAENAPSTVSEGSSDERVGEASKQQPISDAV